VIFIKEGKTEFLPCWKLFDCPEEIKNKCKVYLEFKRGIDFCGGWMHYNSLVGGPAKRGPCMQCEMTKRMLPEIYEIEND
jgi:hypothetical protein